MEKQVGVKAKLVLPSIIGNPVNFFISKPDFLVQRKGNFHFEFLIKMSFLDNFQNYHREFANSSFDQEFDQS